MAVMSSQHPEGVAFEQKVPPVPSSEEMAVDVNVNGTSTRNETSADTAAPGNESYSSSKPNDAATTTETLPSPNSFRVNGAINSDAFASNAIIDATIHQPPPIVSQASENATRSEAPLPHSEAATITSDAARSASSVPEPLLPATSPLLTSVDAAVDSAVEDSAPPSTMLPVIEAQESDVRNTTLPSVPVPVAEQKDLDQSLDLDVSIEMESQPPAEPLLEELSGPADTIVEPTSVPVAEPSDQSLLPSLDDTTQPSSAAGLDLDATQPTEPEQDAPMDTTMQMDEAPTGSATDALVDTEMTDVSALPAPAKIPREREDDDEHEPSAKRTKTDDESIADSTVQNTQPAQNGEFAEAMSVDNKSEVAPLTPYQIKETIRIIKSVVRTLDGKNFRAPVKELWPSIAESYAAKIENQIDLTTIETKLRENAYRSADDFKADVKLLESNAITFNGLDHAVAKSAQNVADSILTKMVNIPTEPPAAVKKEKKAKRSTPVGDSAPRAPPARRQSRGAGAGGADSSAQTFALNPQTSTPLIRRDSTKLDGGRPKREIHPPKNKDLVYSVRPKSRKFDTELKWCGEVLNEFKKPKYFTFASAFYTPVDPVALSIPTYFSVIKTPMDISTIQGKLDTGEYANSKEFEKDVGLIFANCYKFNPVGNIVREWGKQLEDVWKSQLDNKSQWIADHAPVMASHSPSPDSEEEESDDEPEPPANSGSTAFTKRLVEEQAKLIELMAQKDTDPSIVQMQKDMVNIVQKRVNEEAAAIAAAAKKTKKPKAPKTAKKAAPTKKAAAAPKKPAGNRQSQKYLGTFEKEVISVGIASLPDEYTNRILEMIKLESPTVDVDGDGNVELDIDAVSVPTLWKIYNMVTTHAPAVEPELRRQLQEREAPRAPAKPAAKKKNKPMSKVEQERKIEQLKASVQNFERQTSGSQEPLPTVEKREDSSDDESSDSEEE